MSQIQLGPWAPDVADWNQKVCRVATNCIANGNGFRSIPNWGPTFPSGDVYTGACTDPLAFTTMAAHRIFNYSERAPTGEYHSMIAFVEDIDTPQLWVATRLETTPINLMQASIGTPLVYNSDTWDYTRCVFVDWDDEVLIFGNFDPQKITHANITQGLDDSGTTTTSDLGGTPPGARFAAKVGQQVVLGYTAESAVSYPRRVWWSAYGNHEGWTSGTNLAGYEDAAFADGGDITGVVGGEFGLIFQEKQVTRMSFIGSPDIWSFDAVVENEGCRVPGSIVKVGSDAYYYSDSGFKVLRSGSHAEPIGANTVDEWFKTNVGDDYVYMHGTYDEVSGCVFWAFPYTSNYSGVHDAIICFNTKLPPELAWSLIDLQTICLFPIEQQRDDSREFGLGIIVPSATVPIATTIGQEYHITSTYYAQGGDDMYATIETGRIYAEGKRTYIESARAQIDGTYTLALLTQDQESDDTEDDTGAVTPDSWGKCDFDIEARYARLKLVTNDTWSKVAMIDVVQAPGSEL